MRAASWLLVLAIASASGCKHRAAAKPAPVLPEGPLVGLPSGVLGDKQIVTFPSGAITLHGVIYRPHGTGAFPAILWNHGSYDDPMVAFDELGPAFVARGWILFGPFRRGQGLSASAGPYIVDEIDRAGTQRARDETAVRLLAGDHLDDQLAAYAWLKAQPFVTANRIAVAGNSFGGIETILGVERVSYCAAVDGAGAAQSWAGAPQLRAAMIHAARGSRAPVFFFQAENDYDLTPSRTLFAAMREAGKTADIEIYPRFGANAGQGHNFAWHGSSIWAKDVFAFLERHCGN